MAAIIDYRGKTPEKTSSGIPLITAKIVKDGRIEDPEEFIAEDAYEQWMRRGMPEAGDVVLTTEAPLGEVAQLDGRKVALAQRIITLRGKPGVLDNAYLKFALQSQPMQEQLHGRASGSTVTGIKQSELRKLQLTFPALAEQQRVACVLGSLDDKINLNRSINQTLEAMAQAIFKSWFVDFDPIKAKIAAIQDGRDPLRAAMSAISGKTDAELDSVAPKQYEHLAATATRFPEEMEESEFGEIPKTWVCGALGDICSFTAGSAFKPEHQGSTEGDYPFIKVSDMNLAGNEVFIQSANNYVSKDQRSEMKVKLHPLGATVFAKIGVALTSNRRRLLTTPTIIDNNLMSVSPIEGKSGRYFLYSTLSTIDFNTLVSGTALPYVNVSDLKKISIVRPPLEVVLAFEATVSSMFSMMLTLAAQRSTLTAIRNNLLPKLLSGEVEVPAMLGC